LAVPLVVALDTSEIEGQGFSFRRSKALQALVRAVAAGHVKVLVTDIAVREVENRIRERVSVAIQQVAKAHILASTSVVNFKSVLDTLTDGAADDIVSQWREYLQLTQAEVLSTDDMRAGPILDAFFQRLAPFSHKKPSEFRDAFAIGRLRQWAEATGETVHVISKAGDLQAACDGNVLIHKASIADALALLFEGGDALADSALAFLGRSTHALEELVGDSLDNRRFQIEEDWDADVEEHRLFQLNLFDFDVIEVLDDSVLVEAHARTDFEVDATVHDYDDSPRDAGEYVFVYENKLRYTATFDVRLEVSVKLEGEPPIPVSIDEVSVVEPKTFAIDDDAEREIFRRWSDEDDAITD
jgi:hypothetical protein